MERIVLAALVCLMGWALAGHAGELYRWVDAEGKVHYGDTPPPDATQIKKKKFADTVAPDEYVPYEMRRARQNFPVTLYVVSNCAEYCDEARDLLNRRGIPFDEKALKTREDLDTFKELSGGDGFPTLAVGKVFLKGFFAEQWHNELDAAGYPKTAPYRAPRAVPATEKQAAPPDQNPVAPGESTPGGAVEP